jgi:hypothetical protein
MGRAQQKKKTIAIGNEVKQVPELMVWDRIRTGIILNDDHQRQQ